MNKLINRAGMMVMVTGVVMATLVACSANEEERVAGQGAALEEWETSCTNGACELCEADPLAEQLAEEQAPANEVPTSRISIQADPLADKSKAGWGVFLCTGKDNPRDMWQVRCPPNQVATCVKDTDMSKQRCVSGDPSQPAAPANGNGIALIGVITAAGCVGAAVNNWGGSFGTVAKVADLETAAKAFCTLKKGTESACQAYFTKACDSVGSLHKKSCLELTFLACRACPAN